MSDIRSRDNPRLKELRRLRRDRKRREELGVAMLEGPHSIGAALDAGLELRDVFVSSELFGGREAAAPLDALLTRLPRPPVALAPGLLDELADADSPRGIVATVTLPAVSLERWLAAMSARDSPERRPIVAVDRLQDPGNLGSLARVAEAAGAALLALAPGTVDWRHPRALRASTGSLLRLPVLDRCPLPSLRSALDAEGGAPPWLGLSPRGGVGLWDPEALPRQPVVLVVGAEGGGLSDDARGLVDLGVTVPMEPPVESLNATAAAAVVLFELARRRRS